MSDCELLEGCVFFNDKVADMPATAELMKGIFCHGNNARCARYMVFKKLGRQSVPPELFPDNIERAKRIMEGK